MPFIVSTILSALFTLMYFGLAFRYHGRHEGGHGRTLLITICASLGAFWLFRTVGYGLLENGDSVKIVNQVLRYSAYWAAVPAVLMGIMEVRR